MIEETPSARENATPGDHYPLAKLRYRNRQGDLVILISQQLNAMIKQLTPGPKDEVLGWANENNEHSSETHVARS